MLSAVFYAPTALFEQFLVIFGSNSFEGVRHQLSIHCLTKYLP
ncbi:hypothetical protein OH492_00615 [Vibrio chagasii]|nr:hypothetical protein [Vibrio chagasii]